MCMRPLLLLPLLILSPLPVQSQEIQLSETAISGILRVTLANTAKQECDGAVIDDRRLQDEMVSVLGGMAADGLDPVAAVQFLETEDGMKIMAGAESAFRAKHGVDPEGYPALCEAIARERLDDPALALIVTLN